MKKIIGSVLVAALAMISAQSVFAASFAPGNIVVVRYGDGSAGLGSAATAAFLQEFSTGGALQQTINMPTAPSGPNRQFTVSGSATSEGMLTLSKNGQTLTLGGYDAALGLAAVAGTTGAANNRVVARVSSSGTIDTTTAYTDLNGNIRSVVMDGTDIWAASSSNGVRYITAGSAGTSVQLSTTPTNTRVVNLFNNQLYLSAASGTFLGVSTIGSGEPTTSGQTTTQLAGFPTTGSHSNYDYFLANASTLYVCDDGSAANGGGLQKWTESAGTWSLAYTLGLGGGASVGCRGLTGVVNGGIATLYATTNESSNNRLITITDTGSGSLFTDLASSGANTAFRGVEFAPVPEPATLTLLAFGAATLLRRRR